MINKGKFITFEGGDGAGKSTHIKRLTSYLEDRGYEVVFIREPGGTAIGEKIRDILLGNENAEMCSQAELLLFEASRAQITKQIIKPALERGAIVLADRFYDSSVAYQGYARGLKIDDIKQLNMFATDYLVPDMTILMVSSVDESLERATKDGADRIESAGVEFQKKVMDGFKQIAEAEPDRFKLVRLQDSKDDTFNLILEKLKELF
ncbi:MAG: dTMP kinase [Coriobacteriia bacterium]|nr:dTMP kinase [Coriobacteriia bacterium]